MQVFVPGVFGAQCRAQVCQHFDSEGSMFQALTRWNREIRVERGSHADLTSYNIVSLMCSGVSVESAVRALRFKTMLWVAEDEDEYPGVFPEDRRGRSKSTVRSEKRTGNLLHRR